MSAAEALRNRELLSHDVGRGPQADQQRLAASVTFRFLILATKTATRGLVFFKKRPRPGAFLTSWAAAELLTGRHVTSGFHSEVWPRPIGTGVAASTNPSPHLPPTHTADTRCPLISGHCNGGDRAPLPHRPSAPPNKGGGSSLSHLPPPTGQQQRQRSGVTPDRHHQTFRRTFTMERLRVGGHLLLRLVLFAA